jgi:hypothetical protein
MMLSMPEPGAGQDKDLRPSLLRAPYRKLSAALPRLVSSDDR